MRNKGSLRKAVNKLGEGEVGLFVVHLHNNKTDEKEIGNMLKVVNYCASKAIPIFFFFNKILDAKRSARRIPTNSRCSPRYLRMPQASVKERYVIINRRR